MLDKIYDKSVDRIIREYITGSILGYSGEAMEEYLMKIFANTSITESVNNRELFLIIFYTNIKYANTGDQRQNIK